MPKKNSTFADAPPLTAEQWLAKHHPGEQLPPAHHPDSGTDARRRIPTSATRDRSPELVSGGARYSQPRGTSTDVGESKQPASLRDVVGRGTPKLGRPLAVRTGTQRQVYRDGKVVAVLDVVTDELGVDASTWEGAVAAIIVGAKLATLGSREERRQTKDQRLPAPLLSPADRCLASAWIPSRDDGFSDGSSGSYSGLMVHQTVMVEHEGRVEPQPCPHTFEFLPAQVCAAEPVWLLDEIARLCRERGAEPPSWLRSDWKHSAAVVAYLVAIASATKGGKNGQVSAATLARMLREPKRLVAHMKRHAERMGAGQLAGHIGRKLPRRTRH